MEIPTLSDSEEKRPVQSKKSSKTTKKIRSGKLAKEYIMDKVNKAAKQMIDSAAEDDGAGDDDMPDYGDKDPDEYDYEDGFLRDDNSEPTEYASDEESNDEDSDEGDEYESGADDESGEKSDEEIESEEQEERPDEEEILKLPLRPLHVSNKGGERKKQDE
jgi:hypothetical protein